MIKLAPILFANLVGPQALNHIHGVGHRLDAARVDRAHLVHEAKHRVQPLEHGGRLVVVDGNAGEAREAPHVVGGKRHFLPDQGSSGMNALSPAAGLAYHIDHFMEL